VSSAAENTHAVILRSVDVAESDRILHLLVPEHGRVTAVAKGARRSTKRFAGTLDLFNHLRVSLHRRRGAAIGRLEQAVLVRHYAALRSDSARFALACYLLELLDRLAPEGGVRRDMQRLFRFALDSFDAIAAHRPDPALRTRLSPHRHRAPLHRDGAEVVHGESPRNRYFLASSWRTRGSEATAARAGSDWIASGLK